MGNNLLLLSFYYKPDLSAGSFRNTQLADMLVEKFESNNKVGKIILITSMPNRYGSYKAEAEKIESFDNLIVHRIPVGSHKSGLFHQAIIYTKFFFGALMIQRKYDFNLVYASSSRLMTAFLGAFVSLLRKKRLYLDIRDIFKESITDLMSNIILRLGLSSFLGLVEKFTFNRASVINVVTPDMKNYFVKYNKKLQCYTNGIDQMFFSFNFQKTSSTNNVKIITFAGNIGKAQALHKVIPTFAKFYDNLIQINIIGDGTAKSELVRSLNEMKVSNVKLVDPVPRDLLLELYKQSDYLFLHLDDKEAFYRAIPSKLFEYAATDKNIIAGVKGFTKDFITENITNTIVFESNNSIELIEKFKTFVPSKNDRKLFLSHYDRRKIMTEMAEDIFVELNKDKN